MKKIKSTRPAVLAGVAFCLIIGGVLLLAGYQVMAQSTSDVLWFYPAVAYGTLIVCMLMSGAAGTMATVSVARVLYPRHFRFAMLLCAVLLIVVWHNFIDPTVLKALFYFESYGALLLFTALVCIAFALFWLGVWVAARSCKKKIAATGSH